MNETLTDKVMFRVHYDALVKYFWPLNPVKWEHFFHDLLSTRVKLQFRAASTDYFHAESFIVQNVKKNSQKSPEWKKKWTEKENQPLKQLTIHFLSID